MAAFDDQLARLQAQLAAATKVLEGHPEVAAKVSAAMAVAVPDPVTVEDAAQDDARANALARALEAARRALPKPDPVEVAAVVQKKADAGDRGRGGVEVPPDESEVVVRKGSKPRQGRQ